MTFQYEKTVGFRYEPSWMYNETTEYGGKHDELRQKHNGESVKQSELPCRIGDRAWIIRGCVGREYIRVGQIREMFYRNDMQLVVVVHGLGRGIIGESVYLSCEEAREALRKMSE